MGFCIEELENLQNVTHNLSGTALFSAYLLTSNSICFGHTIKNNWLIKRIAVDPWVQKTWSEWESAGKIPFYVLLVNLFSAFSVLREIKTLKIFAKNGPNVTKWAIFEGNLDFFEINRNIKFVSCNFATTILLLYY